ncbi:MAG: T9SS type A sorting domain-containing protein [Bacteroidia bacterium]|nr:T9SS type A sorting domain-containing protein [Bacteroidia bacterium]
MQFWATNSGSAGTHELADQNYKVISDASLRIRVIKASSLPINLNPLSELLAFANYPNPFSGVTNFAYSLPVKGKVILEIRDMLGRIVKQVVNQPQTAGNHSFMMDAHTMNSGLYYATIRLITDNSVLTQTIKIVNTK